MVYYFDQPDLCLSSREAQYHILNTPNPLSLRDGTAFCISDLFNFMYPTLYCVKVTTGMLIMLVTIMSKLHTVVCLCTFSLCYLLLSGLSLIWMVLSSCTLPRRPAAMLELGTLKLLRLLRREQQVRP